MKRPGPLEPLLNSKGKKYKKEADVKEEIKRILTGAGAWFFMPVQNGYGVRGIPDFVVCLSGLFLGIEAKFGKGVESEWQKRQGAGIERARGTYMVINEKNIHKLEQLLSALLDV